GRPGGPRSSRPANAASWSPGPRRPPASSGSRPGPRPTGLPVSSTVFSQIIDWILWLDNQRGTTAYTSRFGVSPIQFVALLVIGRDRFVEASPLRERLTWRSEQDIVASRKVNCVTYDRLYRDLSARLKIFAD